MIGGGKWVTLRIVAKHAYYWNSWLGRPAGSRAQRQDPRRSLRLLDRDPKTLGALQTLRF